MVPRSPYANIKMTIRCSVCGKIIGWEVSIHEWGKYHCCDNKKCRKESMLRRLDG